MGNMKSILKELFISVAYWTSAVVLVVTIRFVGIEFVIETSSEVPLLDFYLTSLPGGIISGLLWGLIEIIDTKIYRRNRKSFGLVVLSKTLVYIVVFFIITFFAAWMGSGSLDLAKKYSVSNISISNFTFFFIASLLFHFFKQMNKKFGPGILFQYITGKYFNPIEEDRIFMFLDLTSSTTIAEKLSHVLYSKLLQDCFSELTDPVLTHKGQIYQYVGDEAVITWEKEKGLENANCLNFFYAYINRLEKKKEYFLAAYDVFPEFKAGLGLGLVTVAEVGELKTEIAYHGDVLNTAARIQGYCNRFDKQSDFNIALLGKVQLRGKEGLSQIFCCDKM